MSKQYSTRKKEGATFTPNGLADFLSETIVSYLGTPDMITIKDPSCGDGALLCSVAKLLSKRNIRFTLEGSDTNINYLADAKNNLNSLECDNIFSLVEEDFVKERSNNSLFSSSKNSLFDVFIANPPYVRTQVLGADKAQQIAKEYGLSGKVDLYYPFIINMTEQLKEGGILGVITSNKYLSTKSGKCVRNYLLSNYDILEIIDLGDTKLFDAAVLPAIFIGKKNTINPTCSNSRFISIYESNPDSESITRNDVYDILRSSRSGIYNTGKVFYNLTIGTLQTPTDTEGIWNITKDEELAWLDTIKANTSFYIGDRFPVRVGVKSCADEVFFNQDWAQLPIPEDVFFREIVSQENISRWHTPKSLSRVVYPHIENNGKKGVLDIDKYPQAKAFFTIFETRLKKRKYLLESKTRKWYEYWVPQNPTLWAKPKIVFADISTEPRFSIDTSGAIVNGNCYWITSDDSDMLYFIVGIANSRTLEKYHDICFNNKLYSGKKRYLAQYIEQYPIPDINTKYAQEIIRLVKILLSPNILKDRLEVEEQVNHLVEVAFGLAD